ncbi:hypothetical protein ACFVXG_38345 [Kitasatospora sp. NPDC058162]|uniref:hypothetical protein n=1 Tax=Kitasatospora sp. NPDC058162 TaxID=3346362 RepID=UPI0036D8D95D
MGNAFYTVRRADGTEIEAGYGVDAVCEQDGCTEQIDRGLDHLCGSTPGAPEDGCGKYGPQAAVGPHRRQRHHPHVPHRPGWRLPR